MNTQEEGMEMYKMAWNSFAMNKRPVFSLKECLEGYGEHPLYCMSDALEIGVNLYGENKEEWNELLATVIQQDMKQQFTYLTQKQAYFLLDSVEKLYIETISDEFGIGTFFSLIERGWIYWFQVEEETRFVVPEELKKIIKDTFFEGELFLQLQKHYELSEYIEAFVNLYGVFEIQHLLAVWNQHHPEDSFALMQLEEFVKEASKYQSVFVSQENLVYAVDGIDAAIAKAMIQSLSHIPYYVPKPEEISTLADREPSAYFQPLEKLVRKWTTPHQSKYILRAVLDYVRLGLSTEAGVKEIVLKGLVDSNNVTFMNTFRLLYDKLFNDSRNWLSRGHTPAEFNWMQHHQEVNISAENITHFPFNNQ